MAAIKIALCTYSYGPGNGIAHMDAALAGGIDPERFSLATYVLRPDFFSDERRQIHGATHIGLAGAVAFLRERFAETDIVQVNGALDPVAANAAASAGVPAVLEVMHQKETGGLHPAIDAVICVSELVRSVQSHRKTIVIHNGIDTDKFSFAAGRRARERVNVVQVANAAKHLHWELGDILRGIGDIPVNAFMVGGRHAVFNLPERGVVSDMASVYHEADLLFLLGKDDAFGLAIAEAMACGTLPIISGDSGAASVILPGKNGWVVEKPENRHDVERVLRHALDTVRTPQFVRMQQNARETTEQKFSQKRMLRDYQHIYTTLGTLPRKAPQEPAAWMELALFAVLYRQGGKCALESLARFNAESRPLEPSFLRHPIGNAVVAASLEACADLSAQGHGPLVKKFCERLYASRIRSPILDALQSL